MRVPTPLSSKSPQGDWRLQPSGELGLRAKLRLMSQPWSTVAGGVGLALRAAYWHSREDSEVGCQ